MKNEEINTTHFLKTKERWESIVVKGEKPKPRYSHSMNLIKKNPICVVFGGKDIDNNTLSDGWILDLFHLNWIEIQGVNHNLLFS